jgi:hypothetical protein
MMQIADDGAVTFFQEGDIDISEYWEGCLNDASFHGRMWATWKAAVESGKRPPKE